MLMKNFVFRPSFFASFRTTAVELVVPPTHAKSAPLFFTERSWEFASIAFRLDVLVAEDLEPELLRVLLAALDRRDPVRDGSGR